LAALLSRLQLVADCWHLLAGPNGSDRREHYLIRGEREPESAYRRRMEAALPSGFFRDALRTFAGMLASSHWRELPTSLEAVISDVDGCGTDLGVFLEAADLAVLRDGAALVGVIPPGHSWPSEGDRQQALRNGDRNSLPRLLLLERSDVLNWHLPANHALPDAITWRERLPNEPVLAPDASLEAPGGFSQGMSPEHWHLRTVALEPGVGMQLTTEELVPDRQAQSGWKRQVIEQRQYLGLSALPAIWYASHGSAFGNGELPHLGLAHQYLNHFCRQSDYQELLYRTALPVGVRTGVTGPMGTSAAGEPVVLGPNSVIDLPEGASFQFVEIQARSLAEPGLIQSLSKHRAAVDAAPSPATL